MNPEEKRGDDPTPANETTPEPEELDRAIEALLFSSEIPLTALRLAELVGGRKGEILEAVDRLNVLYGETGRAFRVSALAGGFQLVTMPAYGALLAKLHKERIPTRLSPAALETLSIIAFKQPVTRAEIDTIRGVSASDGVLRNLIDRKLVRISGRAQAPGRPLLYGTTREFLAYFGLSAISDLPRTDELAALLAGEVSEAGAPDETAIALEELASETHSPSTEAGVIMEPEESVSHSGRESDAREGLTET